MAMSAYGERSFGISHRRKVVSSTTHNKEQLSSSFRVGEGDVV